MISLNKLILCYIPTNKCNLKCEYCIVSQVDGWNDQREKAFSYSVEHMIKALSKERLMGECYINLTAQGETLLYSDIVALTKGLLEEGHFVEIVTNGMITKRIDEILSFPEKLLRRLFFKISYHYNQLKNANFRDRYWENVKRIQNSPCSFTIELMPHDEISGEIDDIIKDCKEHVGAVCHATVGRNDKKHSKDLLTVENRENYVKTWAQLDSTMFELKMDLFGVKRKEFCYAGEWSLLVDLSTGETAQCYGRMNTQNIFKDINKPIVFRPVGHSCTCSFCFNGHAHVAWGIIPELNSPQYYEVRNRLCDDGTNWVKNDCAELFHQKFADNSKQYNGLQKFINSITNPFYLFFNLFHDVRGSMRKAKKLYKVLTHKFDK